MPKRIHDAKACLNCGAALFGTIALRFDPEEAAFVDDDPARSAAVVDSTAVEPSGPRVRTNFDFEPLMGLPLVGDYFERRQGELEALPPEEVARRSLTRLLGHLPKILFLIVAGVALVLELLYIRHGRFYMEHFILALHWHSLLFLVLLFAILNPYTPLDVALVLASPLHLLVALRRVYEQGWGMTLLEHGLLMWSYLPLALVALLALGLLTALTI